jgi:hypothetical protein
MTLSDSEQAKQYIIGIKQIRLLTEPLHIPASTLIKEYALQK